MSLGPPEYNSIEKIWSGPEFNQRKLDVPYGEILLNDLAKHGDKLIQINHDTGERMTCKEMRLKSLKAAEYLEKIGIKRGDHITIIADHRTDLAPLYIGAVAYGAVVNPLFTGFTPRELCYYFELIEPKLIVCDGEVIEKVTESLKSVPIDPMIYAFSNASDPVRSTDDFFKGFETEPSSFQLPKLGDLESTIVLLMCSSGTTSLPKGVLISQAMAIARLTGGVPYDDGLVVFHSSSLYWVTAVFGIAHSLRFRLPRVITAQPVTPDLALEILQKYEVTTTFLIPSNINALAKRLLAENFNLTKLASIVTGGGSLSEDTRAILNIKLPNTAVISGYGMTDMGGLIAISKDCGSNGVGFLVPGMSAKIINDDGNRLGAGDIGEVYLKGTSSLAGYLKNEAATKDSIDPEGWLRTGDIGYFDNDGELFLVDRKKDMIKHKNHQIAPNELEQFIRSCFDVQDIGVVGIPVKDIGFLPAAVVVLPPNSNVTETEMTKAIADNFSDAKQLRGGVYFVKTLPQTNTGKVKRHLVQQIAIELYATKK